MACKGICVQYKTTARYHDKHKRCRICDIFIEWEGMRCPCCSFALRSKARSQKRPSQKEDSDFMARYV